MRTKKGRFIWTSISGAIVLLILVSVNGIGKAQTGETTTRVSVSSMGEQGDNGSYSPSISADGRYVAFYSRASNLVDNDTNDVEDIFVHDRETGVTSRVSVATDGTQANDYSLAPSISANGRYVAFISNASNLVANDINDVEDIFVHDRETGITLGVLVTTDGAQGGTQSLAPSISADGRYVAFSSWNLNLVDNDTNGVEDIFVHDLETGDTLRVSVATDGTQGNNRSFYPSISADGRHVAFYSRASNLVDNDTNDVAEIFVHDRETGGTSRVSVATDGTQANNGSLAPSISADGRRVAFYSHASNLVDNDINGVEDVFVHNLETGVTLRISVATDGTQGNNRSFSPFISVDGRYVAFRSSANNLVDNDTNGVDDIFVHDLETGSTLRVSVATDGTQANNVSYSSSISADGRHVAFYSRGSNLVDNDTNDDSDIFVHDTGGGGHQNPTPTPTPMPTPTSMPTPISEPDRDIIFITGIDSVGSCEGFRIWVPEFLSTPVGQAFFGTIKIGKYLNFNYDGGGNYVCLHEDKNVRHYLEKHTCDGIAHTAGELKSFIEREASNKVTIVAHSMGGVISAYLMATTNDEWLESHIASVVTFDSPHQGVKGINKWVKDVATNCGKPNLDGGINPIRSLLDLDSESDVINIARRGALRVPFYTFDATGLEPFAGEVKEFVPRDWVFLDSARPFDRANWCVSPFGTADPQTCEPPKGLNDSHTSSWKNQIDNNSVDKGPYIGCAILAPDGECEFVTRRRAIVQQAVTPIEVEVSPGVTKLRLVSAFGVIINNPNTIIQAAALSATPPPTTTIRMTLISPDGTVYGPDGTGPVAAYAVSDGSETYDIINPASGTWTVEVFGVSVPPEGADITLGQFVLESEPVDYQTPPFANAGEFYTGTVGIPVTFYTVGSWDPDGTIVQYDWDFESDGIIDVSTAQATVTYSYPTEFAGKATLQVTDNDGLTAISLAPITITQPISEASHIVIGVSTNPHTPSEYFSFSGDASGTIRDGEQIVVDNLTPGVYSVTETNLLSGFHLDAINCDDSNSTVDVATKTAHISLDARETVTCIFVNEKPEIIIGEPDGSSNTILLPLIKR